MDCYWEMINTGERSRLTLALDHFIAKASAKCHIAHGGRQCENLICDVLMKTDIILPID
jgi:hypothetical protein